MTLVRRFGIVLAIIAVTFAMTFGGAMTVWAQSDHDPVGKVTRLQGRAVAMQDAFPRPLKEGDPVLLGDVISTGKRARLEMTMIDEAVMTLGEKTIFVVVDYLTSGDQPNAAMRLLQGVFSATSGNLVKMASAKFTVSTEVATIGVRGTTFWGGTLDGGKFEVALLKGKGIYVETKAGRIDISAIGEGTAIASPDSAPTTPMKWGGNKLARAIATVAFSK